MTNYLLNIEKSETSLKMVDHTQCIKMRFGMILSHFETKPTRCATCGIEEQITPLYDGLCKDCAKHYIYNEY